MFYSLRTKEQDNSLKQK